MTTPNPSAAPLSFLEQKRVLLQKLQNSRRELDQRARAAAKQQARAWMLDPVAWVADVMRFPEVGKETLKLRRQGLAEYQAAALRDMAQNGRLLVYGPHGLGKSTTMSLAVWWFATTRELSQVDWKIVTTASSWKQLNDFLWPEIHKWAKFINWERLGINEPQLGQDLLGLGLKWEWGAASAAASSDPAKMEGAHASHLMYILDEAKAIGSGTWDAIEGAFSTADDDEDEQPEPQEEQEKRVRNIIAVAMSTPGPASGRFYSIATGKPGFEDWKVRKVAKAEVIRAGRMSQKWAEQREKQWGAGSSVYQMRVLGEFFLDDPEALIPLSWIEAAQRRWEDWQQAGRPKLQGEQWLGIDIAGGGADRTVMAQRTGPHITQFLYPTETDLMAQARYIAHRAGWRPVIDTMGVGQGVTSRLQEMHRQGKLRQRPVAFVGSASSDLRNLSREYGFVNQRSAAWWQVREVLDPQNETGAMLPPSPEMVADLCAPTWAITEAGRPPKIRVEPKDSVKKKLGRSPDFGDAVAMAFWAGAARRIGTVAKAAALGGGAAGALLGASSAGPLERPAINGQGGAPNGRNGKPSALKRGGARGTGASQISPLGKGRTAGRTKGGL